MGAEVAMWNPASRLAVAFAVLHLVACDSSPDDSPATCTRSGPRPDGPGDAGNYFPVDPGATWIHETTEAGSGASPVTSRTRLAVTGTALAGGLDATVFTSTPLGPAAAPPSTSALAKGPSGVTLVDDADAGDTLQRQLVPYQLVYFPLVPGESFVQLDCQGLDLGEDLDGDGRNEKLDLRTVVNVVGAEALAARVGQVEAVRVDTRLSMTLHTTRSGSFVSDADRSEWYAAGIGLVRATMRQEVLGETFTEATELLAYSVAGQTFPVPTPLAIGAPVEDELTGDAFHAYSVQGAAGAPYVLAALGLGATPVLEAYGDDPLYAFPACTAADPSASECRSSSTSGLLHLGVRGLDLAPTRYLVLAAPAPGPGPYVGESATVPARTPTTGQVVARGESDYVTTGLTPGAQVTVWLFGLTADADLRVFADETRSLELDCTLGHTDVDARPESCTFAATGDTAYFSVSSGELNWDGAGFLMLVWEE
jgi:hypothetical protein